MRHDQTSSVRNAHGDDSAEAASDDLFVQAGMALTTMLEPERPATAERGFVVRHISGTPFRLFVNSECRLAAAAAARPTQQLCLDLRMDAANIVRFIPPSHRAFMSMPITSFFSRSRTLYPVASHLADSGVRYLGDAARMTSGEFAAALGRFGHQFDAIEREFAAIGLYFAAKSPWWSRPD